MADQNPNPSPAAQAGAALGGAVMGEMPAVAPDTDLPDHSDDIASIFGLGEEAGPVPNSSEGASGGGASPPASAPAAEGGGEQAQPATPPAQQTPPGQHGELTQAPAPAPAPAQPAAPPAAPAPSQGQQPADPTVATLQAQVQALVAHTAQLQEQLAQRGGSQAPAIGPDGQQGGQQQPPNPHLDYRLAIPQDVTSAIFSEDGAQASHGLTHLVNSLARTVHERVLRNVDELVEQRLSQFGGQLSRTQHQEQMRQQYYTAFPQHNDPGINLIVAQEAQAMWQQNPVLQWDQNAMNALGQRVNARLGVVPQPQQPQQQQPQAPAPVTPAPRPAAQMGASPRPAQGDNDGDFISGVLTA